MRRGRHRLFGLSALFLLVIGLVAAGALGSRWTGEQTARFQQEVSLATAAARDVGRDPAGALRRTEQHLGAARRALDALRPLVTPATALTRPLASVPAVGPPAREAVAAWELADAATSLGLELAAAARLGLASVDGGVAGPRLVAAAPALHAHLAASRASFDRAQSARAALDRPSGPFADLEPYLAQWDSASPLLDEALRKAVVTSEVLPALLGGDRPKRYLVLVQTQDELRATGGVITSIGSFEVANGQIGNVAFAKVTAAEVEPRPGDPYVQPPYPLMHYMGVGAWLLRDANWWADFPSSARQAAQFWEATQRQPLDGVIALDETVLEAMLKAVGPIQLADGQVVTADNALDVAFTRIFGVADPARWRDAQSAVSQDLATALWAALERLPAERWLDLMARLYTAARQHDLLVASFDPQVAEALAALGLDGAVDVDRDDYLYLVERNLSYAKLSPFLQRSLEYTVELAQDGKPVRARLAVETTNTYARGRGRPGYPTWYYDGGRWSWSTRRIDVEEGRYGGYTSVYLPLGSQLISAAGFDDRPRVEREGEATAISGYVSLGMAERRELAVEWSPRVELSELPRYRLRVPRQPGAPASPLVVRVVLPPGARVDAADPTPDEIKDNVVTWRTTLDQDRQFTVTPRAPAVAQ